MATTEQIERLFKFIDVNREHKIEKPFDEVQAGCGAVIRLVAESDEQLTAGMLSSRLGISSARMAVILNKLEAKGFVKRNKSSQDARVTIVTLTDEGKEFSDRMRSDFFAQLGRLIDELGEDRVIDFIKTSKEIMHIMKPPKVDI